MKIVSLFLLPAVVVGSIFSTPASAAGIDVSAVLTGINDCGPAFLSIIGALLSVSVVMLGIGKVYSFVKKKAGG